MRPFLPNSTKRIFSASVNVAASLAAMCSLSVLAAGAVTLSSLLAASPVHAAEPKTTGYAAYGEIVAAFPVGITPERVAQAAANSGCEVVGNLSAPSRYYLLRVKGLSRAKAAASRSVLPAVPGLSPGAMAYAQMLKTLPPNAAPVASEVYQAITQLKKEVPGTSADPNWMRTSDRIQQISNVTPNDKYFSQQWDMNMIGMPLAWATQGGVNRTAIVAVIDDGFDASHPDFSRDGAPGFIQPINTINAPTVSTTIDIQGQHGTHVAGTVAGIVNNSVGIAGVAGYNGGNVSVKLLPIQAGYGSFFDAALDLAIMEAVKRGANVINMSLGGYNYSASQEAVVEDAINAGVVVITSSGNLNINLGLDLYTNIQIGAYDDQGNPAWGGPDGIVDEHYPSGYPGVVQTNAVGPTGKLSSYSNYGGAANAQNFKISAPGGDTSLGGALANNSILSTVPLSSPIVEFTPGPEAGYGYGEGTSMATPHVAGAAGLLYAVGVDTKDIINTLLTTVTPVTDPNSTLFYGVGILNVGTAVSTFDPQPRIYMNGGTEITSSGATGVSRATDLGPSYFRGINFNLSVSGLSRYFKAISADPASTSIVLTVQTATEPSSVLQRYALTPEQIGALQSGETKITVRNLTVPQTPVTLGQGRYKAVLTLTYQGNVTDTQVQYFEVQDYEQPIGLALFSVPFQPSAASGQEESSVLGISSGYQFKRFDPLNPLGTGGNDVYFTYQPNTVDESYARFSNKYHTGTTIPLAYGVSNTTTSVAPVGVGYWLNLGAKETIKTSGSPVTEPVAIPLFGNQDDRGEDRVGDGWNLVGAPFPYPVNWNAVSVRIQTPTGIQEYTLADAIANNVINSQLVGYDPATRNYSYNVAPNGQFLPFRAYWIRAQRDCTIVIPPTRASQAATSRAAAVAKTTRGEVSQVPLTNGWRMRIAASVAGDRDAENYFGQTRGAKDGEDNFDVVKPPAGPNHAYVRFINTNSRGKKSGYAFDMRPVQEGRMNQEWTVSVGSDKGDSDVTLTWDGLGNLPRRGKLTLRDSVTGATVAMNSRSSYTYKNTDAGASRQFTITLKSENTSGPLQISKVRTVNSSGTRSVNQGVNVRFTLNQDAEVQGTVKTLSGKVVSTLTGSSRAVAQGEVMLRWDGRSVGGSQVPAGSYILEITARNSNGETTTVKRPVAYLQ